MITVLLILQFFYGLTTAATANTTIDFTKKPIMCAFGGDKVSTKNEEIPAMSAVEIPAECEVLIYTSTVTEGGTISGDKAIITQMVDKGRPVILEIFRNYEVWKDIITPEGNAEDAKAVVDFATSHGFVGVLIRGMSPSSESDVDQFGTYGCNIPPYLKQLKTDPSFYVGISLYQYYPDELADCNIINYNDTNELLDFYIVNTFRLNLQCDPSIFNGETPITSTGGLIGLDSVVTTLKSTSICAEKTYLVVELIAFDSKGKFSSYVQVCCLKSTDLALWCAPTTQDYFDKAAYIKENGYGVFVLYVELDDITNKCGCCPFVGFLNIVAGYKNQSPIPCAPFDAKGNTGSS